MAQKKDSYDNNDEELEEQKKNEPRKKPAQKKTPAKTASKPVRSSFDKGVHGLAVMLSSLALVACGLGLTILAGQALLASFGILDGTPAVNPQGVTYTDFALLPLLIMVITYSVGILFGGTLYKLLPEVKSATPLFNLIGFIIKFAVCLGVGVYVYNFAYNLLLQLGWMYPNIQGMV